MPHKILIVEDESTLSNIISEYLKDEGFETQIAGTALEAIRSFKSFGPDLIVLDLMLPDGGGLSVLEGIKPLQKDRKIPVIVASALSDSWYQEKINELVTASFIKKPYECSQLHAEIKKLLD